MTNFCGMMQQNATINTPGTDRTTHENAVATTMFTKIVSAIGQHGNKMRRPEYIK